MWKKHWHALGLATFGFGGITVLSGKLIEVEGKSKEGKEKQKMNCFGWLRLPFAGLPGKLINAILLITSNRVNGKVLIIIVQHLTRKTTTPDRHHHGKRKAWTGSGEYKFAIPLSV